MAEADPGSPFPPNTRSPGLRVLILAAGLVAGAVAFTFESNKFADFDPNDAGLGLNTVTRHAEFDGKQITGDVRKTAHELKAAGRPVAYWIGASQLHGINKYQAGDQLAVYYASEAAGARGSKLAYVQRSTPNANFHDLLAFYLSLRLADVTPDWLIVAFTYDDLREEGVQEGSLLGLDKIPASAVASGGPGVSDLVKAQTALAAAKQGSSSPVKRNATEGTPQERLENTLVGFLETHWPAYRHRNRLTAAVEVSTASKIASIMGGVMKRRVPPIPPAMEAWNMAAFDSLIALAKADHAKILIYKPPHRPGEVPFYHDRDAYDGFFNQLKARCEKEGLYYADFELLVPANYWGVTNEGRPDVFHFQAYGHRLLGAAVDKFMAEHGG